VTGHARRGTVCQLDGIHLGAEPPRSHREFETDKARPDHGNVPRMFDPDAERIGIGDAPETKQAVEINSRYGEASVPGTDGEHEVIIGDCGSGREAPPLVPPLDRFGAIVHQLDKVLGKIILRPEPQHVRPDLAEKVRLGERRPLIGQARLVADQSDTVFKAFLSQRGGRLEACVSGTHNDDGVHGINSAGQEGGPSAHRARVRS
jgi:hypothetical protein